MRRLFNALFSVLDSGSGSRFRQNFTKVAKANIFSFALPLLAAPILTRLYLPSDFGVLAQFNAVLAIVSSVSALRLDWSVPNARTNKQAAAVVLGAITILLAFSVLFLVMILWRHQHLTRLWPGLASLSPFLLLLPLAIFGSGLQNILQSWHVRGADLSGLSRSKISQSMTLSLSQIGCGFLGYSALGLIVSVILSVWIGLGNLYRHTRGLFQFFNRCTPKIIFFAVKRFFRESTHSTVVSLINALGLYSVPLVLAGYYSATEVGWFALMQRLALVPIGLLTSALAQSFWSESASRIKINPQGLYELYLRTTKRLALASLALIACCLLGSFYTGIIFGAEWEAAGSILVALIPMLVGQMIVSPLSHLVVHRKQHWQLMSDAVRLCAITTLIIVSASHGFTLVAVVTLVSAINFVFYGLIFFLNVSAYKNTNREIII